MAHTLFTYRNIGELRKIQEEIEVFTFAFVETKAMIDACPAVCIDISALVYFLQTNKGSIQPVYVNFEGMTEDTVIISDEAVAASALELLPFLVSDTDDYFPPETDEVDASEKETQISFKPYPRQSIYKYNNSAELDQIIAYSTEQCIPIATFSRASGEMRKEFEQFNKTAELAIMDLTSVCYAIEDNKTLIYALEQILVGWPNVKVIARTSQVDTLLKYFPLFFNGQEPVSKLLPDLPEVGNDLPEESRVLKITALDSDKFDRFVSEFNHNLIGHRYFKDRLRYALRNFVALNKVKEQKVLSIFLFGASGIGKTEVARLLANGLLEDTYLAKINFQNYSSQDALNSLIGSPAGYVGCNHGELSEKINKSKVGVLLCDEFEKTTRPVYSFFLELLEEGRFTDSMAKEYDMDGYVVIFTSNLANESEYKKNIPPELQTRFDLVCEFEEPTSGEKAQFLELLLEKAVAKYPDKLSAYEITEADKRMLFNFDYSGMAALRDIKRVFNNRLMDFFEQKGL